MVLMSLRVWEPNSGCFLVVLGGLREWSLSSVAPHEWPLSSRAPVSGLFTLDLLEL